MTTKQQSSVIAEIKNWLFPGTVTIIGIFAGMMLKDIKDDLAEVKSDVKALMAQSNIDKTRIDNLERIIYKKTASLPFDKPNKELAFETFAILPTNRKTIKNEQNEEILF